MKIRESLKTNERFLAACSYAEKGWHVFPVHFIQNNGECSCGDLNCTNKGKHPIVASGLNDATTNTEQIIKWWSERPYANVAIRTGEISGISVIDIDPRHDGDSTLDELIDNFGDIPETVMAITGGGGSHIIIKHNKAFHSQNNILQGVDIKCDGGYILAEPSNHLSGGKYYWDVAHHPDEISPVDLQAENKKFFNYLSELQNPEFLTEKEVLNPITNEGNRNGTLTSVAGGLRRRGLNGEQISNILHQFNNDYCNPPLESVEVERIAHGMMRYQPEPEPPSTIDPSGEVNTTENNAITNLPLTDSGNRDRLVNRYGKQMLFVPEQGWRIWDNSRWSIDVSNRITEMALNTARVIRAEEFTGVVDKNGIDKAEKWSFASESISRIKAMVELASSHPQIVCAVNELDTHKYLFNAENTTIDLLNNECIDPDPVHRLTQKSRMPYDKDATCPKWCKFMEEILPDKEVVYHLQKILGLSLSGDMSGEGMAILYGEGANGKSILLDVLSWLYGDYLSNAPAHTFLNSSRNESIRNDLAMLRSARLVTVSETNKGSFLDESVIKRTVSGDLETARFLHREFFQFRPQYKIILATNNKPEIKGGSHGTWRRLHLIEFGVKFGSDGHPKAGKKDKIISELKSEASGILNWLIEGFQNFRQEGLKQPKAVEQATQHYREDQDPLVEFINSNCYIDENISVTISDLREAYNNYTEQEESAVWFGRAMAEKGFRATRQGSARTRIYKGSSLNSEGQDLLSRNAQSFLIS